MDIQTTTTSIGADTIVGHRLDEDQIRNVRWKGDVWRRGNDVAEKTGRSFGWIANRALARYLDDVTALDGPAIEWEDTDERGSSGMGYAMTVHFHLPAADGHDQVAYDLKDRVIRELSQLGAREVWTEMQGTRALEVDRRQVPGELAGY